MYFTKVVGYEPKTKKMAEQIEAAINGEIQEEPGARFVSFSVTPNAKAILVFEIPEEKKEPLKKAALTKGTEEKKEKPAEKPIAPKDEAKPVK